MKLFLESQVEIDFDARDQYGDTALSHARENGHEDIVEMLEPHVCACPNEKYELKSQNTQNGPSNKKIRLS